MACCGNRVVSWVSLRLQNISEASLVTKDRNMELERIAAFFWRFLFFLCVYFFALTGVDRVVTGVIKPDVKKEVFQAYVFWQSVMNQSLAANFALQFGDFGASHLLQVLVYVTVSWCWFGGGLDFVYFAMRGEMPAYGKVWHWMPFNPKTWQFAIYAFCSFVALASCWIYVFGVMI